MLNAIDLLKKDHRTVEMMFKNLKEVDKLDLKSREKLFNDLKTELDLHAHIEETIFYPAVRDAHEDNEEMIVHSYEDHAEVKDMLEELAKEDKSDPEWAAKLESLEEDVKEHVKEEEEVILPKAEELLGQERLEELGEMIMAEKVKNKKAG